MNTVKAWQREYVYDNVASQDKIVEVWPKGYADEQGCKRIEVAKGGNINQAVRETFGNWAKVFLVRNKITAPVEPVSEEYARMMSRNDNS